MIPGPVIGVAANILGGLFKDSKVGKVAQTVAESIDASGDSDEVKKQRAENAFTELQGQIEQNKIESKHKSLFVAGWRPFIGWVCGSVVAVWGHGTFLLTFITCCFILWADQKYVERGKEALMLLDEYTNVVLTVIIPLLVKMLGLSALRSWEKYKGISREDMPQSGVGMIGGLLNKFKK